MFLRPCSFFGSLRFQLSYRGIGVPTPRRVGYTGAMASPNTATPAPTPGRAVTADSRWRDPRQFRVHRPVQKRDVPYVPTAEPVVESILDFAEVGEGDVLYDLGCGDGRIVIGAAKRGARGVGVDVDR